MELHLHENPGEGYKTAVAKFKLTNTSTTPIATPAFLSELANKQGVTYQGSRQTNVTTMMNPGLSYMVSYSYIVPQIRGWRELRVKILDLRLLLLIQQRLPRWPTDVQKEETDSTISLYPFDLTVNDVTMSMQTLLS